MRHARGNGPLCKAEALNKAQPHTSTGMMAFDDDQFEQVTIRVGHQFAIADAGLFLEMTGGNLARLDADHLNGTWLAGYTQIGRREGADVNCIHHASKGSG